MIPNAVRASRYLALAATMNSKLIASIEMYKVHGYFGEKRVIDWRMEHLPRIGDTMRFSGDRYGKVTEVVWCMDEPNTEFQRVNIRIDTE